MKHLLPIAIALSYALLWVFMSGTLYNMEYVSLTQVALVLIAGGMMTEALRSRLTNR